MKRYDAIIIGFGKGGKLLAVELANRNWKVAVIERSPDMYGGTCINVGCIPTKTMINESEFAERIYQDDYKKQSKLYSLALRRKDKLVTFLREKNVENLTNNPNITLYDGTASFLCPDTVKVVPSPESEDYFELEGKEIKWRNIRIKTENLEAERMQGTLAPEVNRVPNYLTEAEKADGWNLMFDGKTTNGWRGAHKEAFPDHGWKVEDGQLIVLKSGGAESTNGGDIVSDNEYAAFELSLEFKITPGANSGIKYFVTEAEKQKGSAYGLEYQILDDKLHPDAKLYTTFPGSRTLASLYDMMPAQNKRFNGVGSWNQAVVKVFPNNHVEHWLNGFKTLEYERGSDAFRELVKGSKYAAPSYNEAGRFGEAPQGHILLR